jgi:hypothetical protein
LSLSGSGIVLPAAASFLKRETVSKQKKQVLPLLHATAFLPACEKSEKIIPAPKDYDPTPGA